MSDADYAVLDKLRVENAALRHTISVLADAAQSLCRDKDIASHAIGHLADRPTERWEMCQQCGMPFQPYQEEDYCDDCYNASS